MNRLWLFPPGRHIPIATRWAKRKTTLRATTRRCSLGIQSGEENLHVVPAHLLHGAVRVAGPVARRGTQTVGIPCHHRLVLGLGHLVLAQVKAFGEGDIVLGLVGLRRSPLNRTPHGKSPGSTQIISKSTEEFSSTKWLGTTSASR